MSGPAPASITLRPACAGDCDFVLQMRNDPAVREQSLHREPVPLATHREWFARKLADPDAALLMVMADARPIGIARFEVDPRRRRAVISVAIDAGSRGRGWGRCAIERSTAAILCRPGVREVFAHIRPDNAASERAFRAAGYAFAGRTMVAGVDVLRYRCAPPLGPIPPVLFRCDGGASVGWGHVVRCSALASALRSRGVHSRFLLRDPGADVVRRLRHAAHSVVAIPAGADEVDATLAARAESGAVALVLDSYTTGGAYLDAIAAPGPVFRVVLDDLADRRMRCDMVINPNPGAEARDYAAWGRPIELRGPEFAPLRPEFAPHRRDGGQRDGGQRGGERGGDERGGEPRGGDRRRVLVTLGGSRLGAHAVALAVALDAVDAPFALDLLVGDEAHGAPQARAFAATARRPVTVHVGLDDVVPVLSAATLAVSAAGTTCFELAACGVPALLLIAADNQRETARAWTEHGVFEVLGELPAVAPATVAAAVAAALSDPEGLAVRAARGRAAVDGRGADRIAARLLAAVDAWNR